MLGKLPLTVWQRMISKRPAQNDKKSRKQNKTKQKNKKQRRASQIARAL